MTLLEPTVVAVLTPPGRGAVAVIAVEGNAALEIVERFFCTKAGRLAGRAVNRIAYGRWGAEPAEDVVACRRGGAAIEIHCHGGVAAVNRIVGDLRSAGANELSWPELLARRKDDPIRAAAAVALSQAVTQRTAMMLLDQYHGALAAAIQEIVAHLRGHQLDSAIAQLDRLLARAALGLHLTRPWHAVIAGPPNVGKSSLINALVGYERAIVFDEPGTTRDVVTAQAAFDGWPVQLADTAGLRASDDPLETAGIQLAVAQAVAADCLLLVFDASQPWRAEFDRLIENWPTALVVHNKCDLAAPARAGMATSALNHLGIDELMLAIVAKLIPIAPAPGAAIPFTTPQVATLRRAREQLEQNNVEAALTTLRASTDS